MASGRGLPHSSPFTQFASRPNINPGGVMNAAVSTKPSEEMPARRANKTVTTTTPMMPPLPWLKKAKPSKLSGSIP
jgi:hypothetical protein